MSGWGRDRVATDSSVFGSYFPGVSSYTFPGDRVLLYLLSGGATSIVLDLVPIVFISIWVLHGWASSAPSLLPRLHPSSSIAFLVGSKLLVSSLFEVGVGVGVGALRHRRLQSSLYRLVRSRFFGLSVLPVMLSGLPNSFLIKKIYKINTAINFFFCVGFLHENLSFSE